MTKGNLDMLIEQKQLVWHHTVEFRRGALGPEMRLILVPQLVHNKGIGGLPHVGGRSVYDFHVAKDIPLFLP